MEKRLIEVLKNFKLLASVNKVSLEKTLADLSEVTQDSAHKELFIDIINLLEDLEDRSNDLFEAGIDMSVFEELFFQVIENFFHILYNEKQVNLIHSYLYGIPISKKIPQPVDEKGKLIQPLNPEELWTALYKIR